MTIRFVVTRNLFFASALVILLLFGSAPGFCQTYEVVDLGFLYVNNQEYVSINNSGQVAGTIYSEGVYQAVVWDAENGVTVLDNSLGYSKYYARGINNHGHIAGVGMHTTFEGFYWDGSAMTGIGVPEDASRTYGVGINDSNAITGKLKMLDDGKYHAFLWTSGSFQDLGTLGGDESRGLAINNNNEIVGIFLHSSTACYHAFLWSGGTMQDLGTLGGNYSYAYDINDAGQVAGASRYESGSGDYQAFIWEDENWTELGFLAGGADSVAFDINNLGQVVGYSDYDEQTENHAVLWQDGEIYDLNDLIDPESGWELKEAYDINDNGMILCLGTLNGGDEQYILLKTMSDSDGDGIADDSDNCPATANADQTDTDGDGDGNMCDCDINGDEGGDGAVNMADYAVFRAAYGSIGGDDASENWNADADFNGDLNVNMADYAIFRSRWLQTAPFE